MLSVGLHHEPSGGGNSTWTFSTSVPGSAGCHPQGLRQAIACPTWLPDETAIDSRNIFYEFANHISPVRESCS